jgi:hypothetical protein
MPSTFYRFFVKYGECPWNNTSVFIKFSISSFFALMAYLSHNNAKPHNNPGILEWEDFRSYNQLNDLDDKRKWTDPVYLKEK